MGILDVDGGPSSSAVHGLEQDIHALEQKLSQKRLFEDSLREIVSLASAAFAQGILLQVVSSFERYFKRTRTMLRSRYTNPVFWTATEDTCRACKGIVKTGKLSCLLDDIISECTERRRDTPPEPSRGHTLFEGQLSSTTAEGTPDLDQAMQNSEDFEAIRLQMAEMLRRAQVQDNDTNALGDALLNAEAGAEVFAELLDIDLSQLTGDEPPRRIPAGKHALKCLETIDPIQAKDLARLGGEGTECSICREELMIEGTAQIMPCSDAHVFHPQCLNPWFSENNSCPICRYELETDDAEYELQKTRQKQKQEDDKGAANAQTHNDFTYI